jgi:hypothetical protein
MLVPRSLRPSYAPKPMPSSRSSITPSHWSLRNARPLPWQGLAGSTMWVQNIHPEWYRWRLANDLPLRFSSYLPTRSAPWCSPWHIRKPKVNYAFPFDFFRVGRRKLLTQFVREISRGDRRDLRRCRDHTSGGGEDICRDGKVLRRCGLIGARNPFIAWRVVGMLLTQPRMGVASYISNDFNLVPAQETRRSLEGLAFVACFPLFAPIVKPRLG